MEIQDDEELEKDTYFMLYYLDITRFYLSIYVQN